MLKRPLENQEDTAKCPVCDVYFNKTEGFICIKCRRGPLCKRHKVAGTKECSGCVIERRHKELSILKEQEVSIQGFLRLLQFLFLVFAVLFIALKAGLDDMVEFLQNSLIKDILPFIGVGAFLGYLFFYFILFSQKAKTHEIENFIKKTRSAGR
jgi:hypothetical protein